MLSRSFFLVQINGFKKLMDGGYENKNRPAGRLLLERVSDLLLFAFLKYEGRYKVNLCYFVFSQF
jgi:hypothetical protein